MVLILSIQIKGWDVCIAICLVDEIFCADHRRSLLYLHVNISRKVL